MKHISKMAEKFKLLEGIKNYIKYVAEKIKGRIGNLWRITWEKFIDSKKMKYSYFVDKDNGLKELGPTNNAENAEKYLEALQWAINNDEVRNIAITGAYGSGKTSILRTFFSKHPSIRFLNISLAMFKDSSGNIDNCAKEESKDKERNLDKDRAETVQSCPSGKMSRLLPSDSEEALEKAILEQLFYHVKNDKTPLSRYNKSYKEPLLKSIKRLLLLVYVVAFGAYLMNPSTIVDVCNKKIDWFLNTNLILQIIIVLSLLISFVFVARVIGIVLTTISGIEIGYSDIAKIKVDNNSSASPFQQNLDEVIYFFEQTKFQVVVFEDIDRFENPYIFVKLRELNYLLNNSESIKSKVTFIYSLRDDIFDNQSRTKFFDYILPVIPYLGKSNGVGNLKERFEGIENLNDSGLKEVCLASLPYIDDMRMVNNIGNEYLIYRDVLGNVESVDDKKQVLALVIIKNLYPSAFADIVHDGGLIKTIIDTINSNVKNKREKYLAEITKQEKIIRDANISAVSKREILKNSILYSLEAGQTGKIAQINGISIDDILKDDNVFLKLLSKKILNVKYDDRRNSYSNYGQKTFEKFDEKKIDNKTYLEYWNYLESSTEQIIKEAQAIIVEQNKRNKALIDNPLEHLSEFCDLEDIKDVKKEYPCLIVFIENKFINRNYEIFTNYFKEGEITSSENDYLKSVRNGDGKNNWRVCINNPREFINYFIPSDYHRSEILNIKIVEAMLINDKKTDELNNVLLLVKNNFAFVVEFINNAEIDLQGVFIKKYLHVNRDFINDIVDSSIDIIDKKSLIKLVIQHGELQDIVEADFEASRYNNNINNLINKNNISINELLDIEQVQLLEILKRVGVSIEDVSIADNTIKEELFNNCLVDINYINLRCYLELQKNKGVIKSIDEHKLITTISSLTEDTFAEYVLINEGKWENLLLESENNEESISVMMRFFEYFTKGDYYSINTIESIIKNQETETGDIEVFVNENTDWDNDKLRDILCVFMNEKKFTKNWSNVDAYNSGLEIDDRILDYIEDNINEFEKSESAEDVFYFILLQKVSGEKTIDSIICNHKDAILARANDTHPYMDFSDDVCKQLINKKVFDFTTDNYGDVINNENLFIPFLDSYWDFFKEMIQFIPFSEANMNQIVKSDLSTEQKNQCLGEYKVSVVTDDIYNYAKANKFKNKKLAKLLFEKANGDEKIEVLNNCIDDLFDDIEEYFDKMGGEYVDLKQRDNRHWVSIQKNNDSQKLAELLVEKGYIYSHRDDEKKPGWIKIHVKGDRDRN